jgi:16S rRNA (guanine966-N2)-methyltransferase
VRIVAGEWRGRRIAAPKTDAVRPTSDRVREAWMSIVHGSLPGARVLDLCAGSGALGLEALSRGARFADFVEDDARTIRVLESNVALLGAVERCRIHRADAEKFAGSARTEPYDVAFADPPYRQGLALALAKLWLDEPFATIFGVEHEARLAMPDGGSPADTRRYGETAITFYRL